MKIIAKPADLINRRINNANNKKFEVIEYFVVSNGRKAHFHFYVGYIPFGKTEVVNYFMDGIENLKANIDFTIYYEKGNYDLKINELKMKGEKYTTMQVNRRE